MKTIDPWLEHQYQVKETFHQLPGGVSDTDRAILKTLPNQGARFTLTREHRGNGYHVKLRLGQDWNEHHQFVETLELLLTPGTRCYLAGSVDDHETQYNSWRLTNVLAEDLVYEGDVITEGQIFIQWYNDSYNECAYTCWHVTTAN